MGNSIPKITTFLMFEGRAEEAMKLYTTVFEQSEIISIQHYAANQTGIEGSVQHATFSIHGQVFMCIDNSVKHGFTFTPAISLYVTCDTETEMDRVFEELSQDGSILMPLANYGFSEKFGWLQDKFGVSWQLNLGNLNSLN